jgi:bifunctional DNA-binding transcriptional regulator/antitoxin component of YhaV-PrlF toxin-antitoxin module
MYNTFICENNHMPTLSIHGDVHIPDNLIHALGLKPGAELVFERQGDAIVIRPVKTNKISRVEEGPKILSYTGSTVSQEEMDDAIAKGAAQSL